MDEIRFGGYESLQCLPVSVATTCTACVVAVVEPKTVWCLGNKHKKKHAPQSNCQQYENSTLFAKSVSTSLLNRVLEDRFCIMQFKSWFALAILLVVSAQGESNSLIT